MIRSVEFDDDVERFDVTTRAVHWTTAVLVGLCVLTALALTFSPIATLVGRRALVRDIHVAAGLLIPLPIVIGVVAGRWSAGLRRNLRDLDLAGSGKFRRKQQINAAAMGGALVLLFATGIVLRWFEPFPLSIRRGATFVHDWVAFLLSIDLLAHVVLAFSDREAMRAMLTGRVSARWAALVHPRWRV